MAERGRLRLLRTRFQPSSKSEGMPSTRRAEHECGGQLPSIKQTVFPEQKEQALARYLQCTAAADLSMRGSLRAWSLKRVGRLYWQIDGLCDIAGQKLKL